VKKNIPLLRQTTASDPGSVQGVRESVSLTLDSTDAFNPRQESCGIFEFRFREVNPHSAQSRSLAAWCLVRLHPDLD